MQENFASEVSVLECKKATATGTSTLFIRPFEKTVVLCYTLEVRRLSVRPFVRLVAFSFPDNSHSFHLVMLKLGK